MSESVESNDLYQGTPNVLNVNIGKIASNINVHEAKYESESKSSNDHE